MQFVVYLVISAFIYQINNFSIETSFFGIIIMPNHFFLMLQEPKYVTQF